jgi:glutamate-1-semialdehyde 2,1-aminomutase
MTAMNAFLRRLDTLEVRALYEGLDESWNARAERFNVRMELERLPIRVANLSTIWTVYYTEPSRYNWMLQFYLRLHGVALSWIGTGRLIFTLNHTEVDFQAVLEAFVAAARAMRADGWWWTDPALTNRGIRRGVLREMLAHRLFRRRAA